MAGQRDPIVTLAVLGVMGFVGWQWAQTQPANSSAKQTVDRIRATVGKGGGGAGRTTAGALVPAGQPAAPAGQPAAAPAPGAPPAPTPAQNAAAGLTIVQQYNEQHADGWYQATQWSDGHWDWLFIDPSQYLAYGIPTDSLQSPDRGSDPGQPAAPVLVWGPMPQLHEDGAWWLDSGFSDGTTASVFIDPSQWPQWGIFPDGSAADPQAAALWQYQQSWRFSLPSPPTLNDLMNWLNSVQSPVANT